MTVSDAKGEQSGLVTQEVIVAAWAEPASGPGWSNRPIWVCVWDGFKHRLDCLQPEEQTEEMRVLYDTCAAACSAMTEAVRRAPP